MRDFARSTDPAVQRQLDRLAALAPGADILGLQRITALLDRLGNPEGRLPPVFHVAGTNGKGSTCAVLRACAEAAGLSAHVYTSPHLVRFNERIRVAGRLIADQDLALLLEEVLDADTAAGIGASFFEASTAVAFLAFTRTPADLTILEVGMGGRLDATNVIDAPAIGGIAALGLDHQAFLGGTLEEIAGEKAGIAKPGVAIATLDYPPGADARVERTIAARGGRRLKRGRDWEIAPGRAGALYRDGQGEFVLPPPRLPGLHQIENSGLALAMLRHQQAIPLPLTALVQGPSRAQWPARLQRLAPGPLAPDETWLDGGHNPSAAAAIAAHFTGRRLDIVIGMLANKDADAFLELIRPVTARVIGVPVSGHDHHAPQRIADLARAYGIEAEDAADLAAARARCRGPVLITGSLYLAGEALALNGEPPQ